VGLDQASLNVLLGCNPTSDILPNRSLAAEEFRSFKVRCLSSDFKESSWTPEWFSGLQRQYRGVTKAELSMYGYIGRGEVQRQFAFGFSLLPPNVREFVRCVLVDELCLNKYDNPKLLTALKELSELAKHHGPLLFGEHWPYLTETHLLFGAEPMTDDAAERMLEQFSDWVFHPKEEDEPGSLREEVIMRGLDLFFSRLPRTEAADFDKFVTNPSIWLANGASDAQEKLLGTKKTKFASYLGASRDDIQRRLLSEAPPSYRFLEKRERGKIRNLVSGANDLNDQMAFLGMNLTDTVYDTASSSLGKGWSLDSWLRWANNMRKELAVGIDQSTFDHVPSMRVLQKVVDLLADKGAGDDPFAMRVAACLKARFSQGTIHASLGSRNLSLPHKRGVLSGWNWTALIDTIVNVAEVLGIFEKLGINYDISGEAPPSLQGDDLLLWVQSWSRALNLVHAYRQVLPVNPNKFFLDMTRMEYLRLVLTPTGRFGYFWRALPSILYANAWSGGKVVASAIASKWSLIHGRGAQLSKAIRGCVRDLCGHLACTADAARRLLQTPTSIGGLGVFCFGEKPLLTRADGAVALRTPKVVSVGGRELQANTFDRLAKEDQRLAISNGASWFQDDWMGDVCAKSVAAGVVMKQKPSEEREVLADPQPVDYGKMFMTGWSNEPPPRPLIDNFFLEEAIRKAMAQKDLERVLSFFEFKDRANIKYRYSHWARNVWFDWVLGRLVVPVGHCWGDAADVNPWVRRALRKDGNFGVIPTFGHSRAAVRARMTRVECRSAFLFRDLRLRFRG